VSALRGVGELCLIGCTSVADFSVVCHAKR